MQELHHLYRYNSVTAVIQASSYATSVRKPYHIYFRKYIKRRNLYFLSSYRPRQRAHECRGLALWCRCAASAQVVGGGVFTVGRRSFFLWRCRSDVQASGGCCCLSSKCFSQSFFSSRRCPFLSSRLLSRGAGRFYSMVGAVVWVFCFYLCTFSLS